MGDTTRHEADSCGCEPDGGHHVSPCWVQRHPAGNGFSTDWCLPDPIADVEPPAAVIAPSPW